MDGCDGGDCLYLNQDATFDDDIGSISTIEDNPLVFDGHLFLTGEAKVSQIELAAHTRFISRLE